MLDIKHKQFLFDLVVQLIHAIESTFVKNEDRLYVMQSLYDADKLFMLQNKIGLNSPLIRNLTQARLYLQNPKLMCKTLSEISFYTVSEYEMALSAQKYVQELLFKKNHEYVDILSRNLQDTTEQLLDVRMKYVKAVNQLKELEEQIKELKLNNSTINNKQTSSIFSKPFTHIDKNFFSNQIRILNEWQVATEVFKVSGQTWIKVGQFVNSLCSCLASIISKTSMATPYIVISPQERLTVLNKADLSQGLNIFMTKNNNFFSNNENNNNNDSIQQHAQKLKGYLEGIINHCNIVNVSHPNPYYNT